MYRKKNATEKAKDLEMFSSAARKEHKVVSEIISEASEWGASGYARLGGMYFIKLEDAHGVACGAYRQIEDTHVGDYDGAKGKWDHTTVISDYEDD